MEEKFIYRLYEGDFCIEFALDRDTMTSLDLYADLLTTIEDHPEIEIPHCPLLVYHYETSPNAFSENYIANDADMMNMLSLMKGAELIKGRAIPSEEPCEALMLALSLRGKKREDTQIVTPEVASEDPVATPKKAVKVKHMASGKCLPGTQRRRAAIRDQEQAVVTIRPPRQAIAQSTNQAVVTCRSPRTVAAPSSTPSHIGANEERGKSVASKTPRASYEGRKVPKSSAKKWGICLHRSTESSDTQPSSRKSRVSSNTTQIAPFDQTFSDSDDMSYDPSLSDVELSDDDYADVVREEELVDEDDVCLDESDDMPQGYVDGRPSAANWADDDDSFIGSVYRNGVLFEDTGDHTIDLQAWYIFTDKEHFMEVLTDYCIQEGFSTISIKSDSKRVTVECAGDGCGWRLHSSALPDGISWAIKSVSHVEHTCSRLGEYNPMVTTQWAAKQLLEDVRANPELPPKALNNMLFERFGVRLKTASLYRMRDAAIKMLEGGHDESYALLPAYCEMVISTNPGSYVYCVSRPSEVVGPERPLLFNNFFIALHATVEGAIRGVRPLIGVDGTHLKGNYGGILLTAVALDGNNEIFPIAWSVVSSETADTWKNFFARLKNILTTSGRVDWTIISDRQKGVEPALDEVWPEAKRRICCRHLCMNFKKSYPGPKMHKVFWMIVDAFSEFSYRKAIEASKNAFEKMKKKNKELCVGVEEWLKLQGPLEWWARCKFDPLVCSESHTSNFVESFNAQLGDNRRKPVLTLLEEIRRSCMVRHAARVDESEKWDAVGITPYAREKLEKATRESRSCKVYKSSGNEFEIVENTSSLPVSLDNRTCACGVWQITGIPCRHAVRAISHIRAVTKEYVSHYYTVRVYRLTYGLPIRPIPDPQQWPAGDYPVIQPPTLKRGVGRPSRTRKREDGERRKGKRSTTVRCGKCKQLGHNGRTCKGGLTARERQSSQLGEGPSRGTSLGRACSSDTSYAFDTRLGGDFVSSAPWTPGSQPSQP